MNAVLYVAFVVAWALATLRWLRVAQREHYLPGSALRFARRWWIVRWPNPILGAVALAGVVLWLWWPGFGLITAAAVAAGPVGLGLRGTTSPLRWTGRLRRVAIVTAGLEAIAVALAILQDDPGQLVGPAVLAPALVDLALFVLRPVETRMSERFVDQARTKLKSVSPRVVAITGSYGKTSTKEHLRLLASGTFDVAASPASFNNRLGLARTINEQVTRSTQVLIAEIGTYGPGEIADIVSWLRPEVSVLTAIGPVHLERFGSLDAIAAAKAEIFTGARVIVVNADDDRVTKVAEATGHAAAAQVLRCSTTDRTADVFVATDEPREVQVGGERIGVAPPDVFATNVACAVGAALALGVPPAAIGSRLAVLQSAAHRREVIHGDNGVVVIDDSYNANPAGAAAALDRLAALSTNGGRRIVVTPGIIELGPLQEQENAAFAEKAGAVATDFVVVRATNYRALRKGAARQPADIRYFPTRARAVEWVRSEATAGDVVLYENDLPDHYP